MHREGPNPTVAASFQLASRVESSRTDAPPARSGVEDFARRTPSDDWQVGNLPPRSILEIEPATQLSPELIRRRFLLLTERADPIKAAALGPEFAAMAEAKRVDIRRAALQLMEPFGEPLDAPATPPPPSDIRHNPDLDDVFGA